MSLSNPQLVNPANRRFEWAGKAGKLQYYDKATKQSYEQPLPFRFIVLDQLNTVAGFSKADQSSIWANEIRNIKNDELFTRTSRGPIEAGLWENLAATTKAGGKFCKSIYIAYQLNGNWVIGNFRCYGSAVGAWFEFLRSYSVEQGMVSITRGNQMTNGDTVYFPPEYSWQQWDDGAYQVAVQLDKQLQIYLNQYLAAPKVDEEGQGTESSAQAPGYATPAQRADYEQRRVGGNTTTVANGSIGTDEVIIEDIGDEPINLDDIPF